MSELNEMGNMLMNIALQYTHPNFSDMYHDWGAVFKAGEELVEMDKEAELNDNQKIVLEWLKENKMDNLFLTTARLHRGSLSGGVTTRVKSACGVLDSQQQAQVLKAFAEWGLEQWQTTDTGE